jgi:hypothetical protein
VKRRRRRKEEEEEEEGWREEALRDRPESSSMSACPS